MPRTLAVVDQWQRIATVLTTSVGEARHAESLQTKAAQQIDLATYALYNLVDELAAVMEQPLGRVRASVHNLEPPVRMTPVVLAA